MNDALAMGVVQRQTDFANDPAGIFRFDKRSVLPVTLKHKFQIRPFNVLDRHIQQALHIAIAIQLDNMWMFQFGNSLSLALEAQRVIGVSTKGSVNHLEGNLALEAHIQGAIDTRHTALAEERLEPVFIQLSPEQGVFRHGKNTSQVPTAISQRATSSSLSPSFQSTRN